MADESVFGLHFDVLITPGWAHTTATATLFGLCIGWGQAMTRTTWVDDLRIGMKQSGLFERPMLTGWADD